jgi:hypothetical protein
MFTKALSFIKSLFGSFSGIAPLLALFGVAVPPVAIAAIPIAIGLMDAAEQAFGDGTGAIKKEVVSAGLTAFSEKMTELSTGGQKETWATITPNVGAMIDTIATVANNIAAASGSATPIFTDDEWEKRKLGIFTS